MISIIIVKVPTLDPSTGYGTRYMVIVPEGFGQQVLRRFVYSGCRAIAIKEYLAICLHERVFPFDYPETRAGQHWLQNYCS